MQTMKLFQVVVVGRKAGAIGIHNTERREFEIAGAADIEQACDYAREQAIEGGIEHTSIKFAKELKRVPENS